MSGVCYDGVMPQNYVDYSRFIELAPEFAALDQPFVEVWIDFTKVFVDLNIWGECAEAAHFFVTAHFLETHPSGGLAGPGTGGEAGPLTAEANGPASRSFAVLQQGGESGWAASSYGRKYLLLQSKIMAAYRVLPVRNGYQNGMSRIPHPRRRLY